MSAESPIRQGYAAGISGNRSAINPHAFMSIAWLEWRHGWRLGCKDRGAERAGGTPQFSLKGDERTDSPTA